MQRLGTPDDPAAFTDFDPSNPVEVLFEGRTYFGFRLAAAVDFDSRIVGLPPPRLMFTAEPKGQPIQFGVCEANDTRETVVGKLRAFLRAHQR